MTAPDERLVFDLVARDRASRDIDRVGDAAIRAGRDFDRASDGAGHLQAQIDQTTINLRELGREFDRTGNRALLKDIGRERRTLSGLQKVRRELVLVADVAEDVGKFTLRGLTGAIESLPQQLKGAVIIGVAGAATAAAPVIGAALTGAIVGAVGTGAIAAGIAGAARSPEVKAAWDDLASEGKNAFAIFSEPFVEPTVQAIRILQDALVDIRGDIGAIGDDASRLVEPLTRGVAGFARAITPGLRSLVREAGPVFDMFEDELPRVGRALGDFFADLGDGAEGGADSLRAFLRVVEFSLEALGEWFKFLSDIIEGADFISSTMGGALNSLFEKGPAVEEMAETGETAFGRFEESAKTAAEKVEDFNRAIQDAFTETMNLDQAAIDFKLGLIGLRDELADNGRTFDENSEAGLRNRDVLLEMIDKANNMREAAIAQGDGTREGTDKANAAYDDQIAQIRAVAVAFGLSAAQIDTFIAKYQSAALQPNLVKTIKVRFVTQGQAPPAARMGELIAFQHGGPVTGPGPRGVDSVPAVLAPGEFVLSSKAVDRIGLDTLQRLNRDAGIAAAAATPVASAPMSASRSGPVVIRLDGADDEFKRFFRAILRRNPNLLVVG